MLDILMASLSVNPSTGPVADNFLYTWGSNTSGQLGDPTLPQVAASWSAISGGANHTLGIKNDGTLWAWGSNASGQLGDGTTVTSSTPLQIGTASNWSKIVTGVASSYAIKSDGALFAWGSNNNGQLGDGTIVDKSSPVQLGSDSWTLVDAGEFYMHAIRSDGTLWGSGLNTAYQLGDGTAISKSSPVQIGVGTSWVAINSGDSNAMAISSSNKLYTWGTDTNQTGYLGQLSGLRGYTTSSGSYSHTVAIASDGTLWGWGKNTYGQLGFSDLAYRSYPTQIASGSWSKVAANNKTTVAIKSDGTLWAAGTGGPNAGLQTTAPTTLTQSGTDTDWLDVSITSSSTSGIGIGLKTNGRLYAWTSDVNTGTTGNTWALGVGATAVQYNGIRSLHDHILKSGESWTAVSVGASHKLLKRSDGAIFASGYSPAIGKTSVKSWTMISSGQSGVMGIDSQGRLYTWGRNSYGQLGKFDAGTLATAGTFSYPSITNSQSWTHVTVQNYTTLGILANGELWGFGRNTSGELMTTAGTAINSPTLIDAGPWSKVEMGRSHVIAIKANGTLWTWGVNAYGQLGDGTITSRSSPVQIGTDTYTEITGGLNFSLALRSDGTLWSWGGNSRGQLGRGNTTSTSSPVQVGTSSWTAVSAGPSHVAAIRSDGLLFTWGYNNAGQLGDNSITNRNAPVQIGNNTWSRVRSGGNFGGSAAFTQAIRSDGTLWGWGDSGTFNVQVSSSSPVQIGSDTDWAKLASRWGDSSAAIKTNGLCYTWGSNVGGQIGDGTTNNNSVPTLLGGSTLSKAEVPVEIFNKTFDKIYAGGTGLGIISYGIDSLGKLWAWGSNDTNYLLGDGGALASTDSPVQIGSGTSWTAVSAGHNQTLAISTTGQLYGWGTQLRGQLMNGSYLDFTPVSVPTLVNSDTDWTWVDTDIFASRAGKSNTYMYTAGYNLGGRLGIGQSGSNDASVPTLVGNNTIHQVISPVQLGSDNWSKIGAGKSFSTAIKADSTLWTWGLNNLGQLGLGDTVNRNSPVQVGTATWKEVSAGMSNAAAIKSDDTAWIWGGGGTYQLASGNTLDRSSPVQIGTNTYQKLPNYLGTTPSFNVFLGTNSLGYIYDVASNSMIATATGPALKSSQPGVLGANSWTVISAGSSHIAAIRSDNTLWTWGSNDQYQLGLGDTTTRYSPVQVGTNSWTAVSAGDKHTIGIRSNGSLYAWGKNDLGQVGGPGLAASWNVVGRAAYGTHAITTTGELYAWGSLYSSAGSLFGDGSTSGSASVPVQIGVGSTWSKVYNRGGHTTLAIKTDGTLWAWGRNNAGQLGQGDTTNRPSMVQVGSDTNWKDVIIGGNEFPASLYVLAVKTNGTLWAWGYNETNGMLGVGDTVSRSSPTQVGALTDWDKVAADATNHSMAIKTDGSLWSWGFFGNASGRTGPVRASSPVQISAGSWRTVVGGENWFAGVKTDNTLWLWGDASPLMNSVGGNTSVITQLGTDTNWSTVTALRNGIHALKTDGTLWAWGSSNGLGTALLGGAGLSSPVQIASGISKLANPYPGSNSDHANYITAGGALYQWSNTTNGTFIGDGSAATNSSPVVVTAQGSTQEAVYISPVAVSGATGSWTSVSAGASHNAAIKSTGSLWTWGAGANGRLGLSDTTDRSSPVQVGTSSWTAVSAGQNHTLGIKADGSIMAWGSNADNQLAQPPSTASWTSISNRVYGALGIADGNVYYWGGSYNSGGPNPDNMSSPVLIGSGGNWSKTFSGIYSNFAIRNDGTLWAWGHNNSGQLGVGDLTNRTSPTQVGTATNWASVSTGGPYSIYSADGTYCFGIRTDGTAWFWGDGRYYGQSGLGSAGDARISSPVQLGSDTNWSQIHGLGIKGIALGLKTDGTLYSWGTSHAALGRAAVSNRSSPVQIGSSTDWAALATGEEFAAALKTDGTLWLWGVNAPGIGTSSSPVQLGTESWAQIRGQAGGIYALKSNGDLYAWGTSQGTGNTSLLGGGGSSVPVQIASGVTVLPTNSSQNIRAGRIIKSGVLNQWSTSYYNVPISYLGGAIHTVNIAGAPVSSVSSPAAVSGTSGSWTLVSAGTNHSMAIKSDGKLYAWGGNAAGQLGTNDTSTRSSAVQVGSASWTLVSAGNSYTVAVNAAGKLFAWGLNATGQLGDASETNRLSPVQIGTADWTKIDAGSDVTAGIS